MIGPTRFGSRGRFPLERLQKGDERPAVVGTEIESKRMAPDGTSFAVDAREPGRHVVVTQTRRIEPVVQRSNRSGMLQRPAVPEAFQRGHLVVAGAPARPE